ncbi:MAG: hypothetical protein U9O41_09635 [Candidatus Aerophobetes bacterium]|nr:hypothetical protein [Candidatus Aerophobetes bacterium]
MTMNYESLKNFVREVIEVKGGIAEEKEKGVLEVILPKNIGKDLFGKEYERLSFLSDQSQTKFITYGSPLLDKVISLTEDLGKTARTFAEDIHLKKKGLARLIEDNFDFPNTRKLGSLIDREVVCSYLLINFRVSIISDERKEEIVTASVDEHTLRIGKEIINPILELLYKKERPPEAAERYPTVKRYPIEKVYERAKKAAIRNLEQSLKDVEKSSLRRLKRDITRLWSYYKDLKEELKKRMMKEPYLKKREELSSKMKAVEMEFERKKEDLTDNKYSLKITLQPINACRVYLPKIVSDYEIQRKTSKKKLEFFWNPLTEEIEPLVCQACLEDTYAIYLCDELHLICPNCYFRCEGCGRKICKKCFPEKCPTCGRRY